MRTFDVVTRNNTYTLSEDDRGDRTVVSTTSEYAERIVGQPVISNRPDHDIKVGCLLVILEHGSINDVFITTGVREIRETE